MKLPLAIAAIILVVGSLFGWQERQHLTNLREERLQLAAEAEALGLTLETGEDSTKTSRSGQRQQREAQRAADARAFAAEVIAFARTMKAAEESRDTNQQEMQKRTIVLMDRLLSLDKAQLEILIDEVRRSPDLDDDMREGIIGFSIMMLANDHPEAALAIYTGSTDMLGPDHDMSEHVISSALSKWAQRDPMAALEWIRENSAEHPDLVSDESKKGIIAGAAVQDPRLAFRLIDELEFENLDEPAKAIVRAAHSSTQRTAVLGALRDHLETIDDETARQKLAQTTMNELGGRMSREGFDSSMKWLSENQLSDSETEAFAASVSHHRSNQDTGRWIDWMSDKVPASKLDQKVGQLVSQWTHEDYAAAGTWLNDATGPARDPAVRSYAKTVAPYEPQTAANWALTLPASDERTGLLKTIHGQWKSRDEPAAARFAEQHGLEE